MPAPAPMTTTRTVFVAGVPVPQGSATAYVVRRRDGRAHANVTHANEKTGPWRDVVAAEVRRALGPGPVPLPRPHPVRLDCEFIMPRRAREKTPPEPHTRKPDRDKLLRAVCDALTGVVYDDDSQIVVGYTIKRTAAVDETPGAILRFGEAV